MLTYRLIHPEYVLLMYFMYKHKPRYKFTYCTSKPVQLTFSSLSVVYACLCYRLSNIKPASFILCQYFYCCK